MINSGGDLSTSVLSALCAEYLRRTAPTSPSTSALDSIVSKIATTSRGSSLLELLSANNAVELKPKLNLRCSQSGPCKEEVCVEWDDPKIAIAYRFIAAVTGPDRCVLELPRSKLFLKMKVLLDRTYKVCIRVKTVPEDVVLTEEFVEFKSDPPPKSLKSSSDKHHSRSDHRDSHSDRHHSKSHRSSDRYVRSSARLAEKEKERLRRLAERDQDPARRKPGSRSVGKSSTRLAETERSHEEDQLSSIAVDLQKCAGKKKGKTSNLKGRTLFINGVEPLVGETIEDKVVSPILMQFIVEVLNEAGFHPLKRWLEPVDIQQCFRVRGKINGLVMVTFFNPPLCFDIAVGWKVKMASLNEERRLFGEKELSLYRWLHKILPSHKPIPDSLE